MLRRALALAIPCAAIPPITVSNAQTDDYRQAVDTLFRNFADAYGRNDADGIGACFTEDAILIGPAPIVIGRQAIAQNYKGRFNQGFGNIRFQLQHYDPNGVWVAGTYTVSLPQGAGDRHGNVTSIFRRQANAVLIHVHTFNFRT
ncbi:nuclear transport factor 2 family protein [Roseomonas sp. CAU 1739]|uniref:YybH family protein n=1 Tax=Roseomonas sp. CAU 1739 TaxID=3140364 RepID=UPI00325B81B8